MLFNFILVLLCVFCFISIIEVILRQFKVLGFIGVKRVPVGWQQDLDQSVSLQGTL